MVKQMTDLSQTVESLLAEIERRAKQGYVCGAFKCRDVRQLIDALESRAPAPMVVDASRADIQGAIDIVDMCLRTEPVDTKTDAVVGPICERLGYGAVMSSASRQWRVKDSVRAFLVGPCVRTAEIMREGLTKGLVTLGQSATCEKAHALEPELAASKGAVELLRAEANETHFASRIARATHRCKVCDARWIKFDWGWSMASKQCGKCCDVVAMGDQIEPIGLTAEIEEYAALTEKLSGLLRDIANVLRGPPGELSSWGFTGLDELGVEILAERDRLKAELAAAVATMEGCIYSAHHGRAMNKRLAMASPVKNEKV